MSDLARLFLQLLVIIGLSRVVGKGFTRIGIPAVVGEMTTGILLGPSLFGWLAPGAFAFVFPADSLGARACLVIGDAEAESGQVQLKDLASHSQETCALADVVSAVTKVLASAPKLSEAAR